MLSGLLLAVWCLVSKSIVAANERSSLSSHRLVALIKNTSPILNIFEKYTEFFVVIGAVRHAIEREEIHRYDIAFEITRLSQRYCTSHSAMARCCAM